MKKPRILPSSPAFSLVEILVAMGVVALLAALVTPAVNGAIERSRAAACISNLREIGKAMFVYANENDGRLPAANSDASWPLSTFMYQLNPYLGGLPTTTFEQQKKVCFDGVFRCRSKKNWNLAARSDNEHVSYGMNTFSVNTVPAQGPKLAAIENPGRTVLVADLETGYWALRNAHYMYRDFTALRHNKRDNVLFCDGHVESVARNGLTWDLKLE